MAFTKKVMMTRPLRYGAKAGVFQIVRSFKRDDGTWDNSQPEDITDKFRAICDLKNVGACWLNFVKGEGPQVEGLIPMGHPMIRKPGKGFQEAFRLLCMLDDSLEDGTTVREILSSANVLRDAFSEAHTAYEAGARAHHGQLPVLIIGGKTEVEIFEGIAFQPKFVIDGWVPRPNELPDVPPIRMDYGGGGGDARSGSDARSNNESAEAYAGVGKRAGGVGAGGAMRTTRQEDLDDEIPF